MSYFPKDDLYVILMPITATLTNSGSSYGKYHHSPGHVTATPQEYWNTYVTDYTDGNMDSEEVGSGSYIIPFDSTLVEVHLQYEDRKTISDDFDVVLAKNTEATGTGQNSTLTEGYVLSVAGNNTSYGNGYAHYHSATGLTATWAQDDLIMPFLRRTNNQVSYIEPILLLTCVFKRTG